MCTPVIYNNITMRYNNNIMISDRIVVLNFFFFRTYKVTACIKHNNNNNNNIYVRTNWFRGHLPRAQSKCSTRFSDVVINTRNIVIDYYWAQYLFYAWKRTTARRRLFIIHTKRVTSCSRGRRQTRTPTMVLYDVSAML